MRRVIVKGDRERENQENTGVFLGSFRKEYIWMLKIWKWIPSNCSHVPPKLYKFSFKIFILKKYHSTTNRWHLFCLFCSKENSLERQISVWKYWTFRFGGHGTFSSLKIHLQIHSLLNYYVCTTTIYDYLLNKHIFCICYLQMISGFSTRPAAGLVHDWGTEKGPWRFSPSLWSSCSKSVC